MQDLNALAAEIHAANSHWWHNPANGERLDRNKGELLMLVVSELAEAMEGERKDLMDDHLPHRKMAEVELADVLIRVFDFAGGFGIELKHAQINDDFRKLTNKGEALLKLSGYAVSAYYNRETPYRVGVELSLLVDGLFVYANKYGHDVWGAMAEKRAYNAIRADHKAEARLAANGKKW